MLRRRYALLPPYRQAGFDKLGDLACRSQFARCIKVMNACFFEKITGCLAQLVERRPYKANVGGSIPPAPTSHHGVVVQLVRIPACHAGGRGFEPRPLRQFLYFAEKYCHAPRS